MAEGIRGRRALSVHKAEHSCGHTGREHLWLQWAFALVLFELGLQQRTHGWFGDAVPHGSPWWTTEIPFPNQEEEEFCAGLQAFLLEYLSTSFLQG